ncbi:MAG: hypothetical protein J6X55_12035 [Victivallales bacterium]|nr:hypothetical protein [Victivallales bacterium]
MRDLIPSEEERFFELFKEYFDLEKNVVAQHTPENYTLERMTPLAEVAGHPEARLRIIHIAGTKGKGSTSHFISALLQASGHSVGLFTSPHLATVRERFQLNNELISYDMLMSASKEFINKLHQKKLTPSLFEIFTVMALKIFADNGMEYAVMETGIGGLLDATNYVPAAECCAITPVSFDHTALLGNTIEKIASQKAGIIKKNTPVVIAKQPYSAADNVIVKRAEELGAPVVRPMELAVSNDFLPSGMPPFLYENFTTAMAVMNTLKLRPDPTQFHVPQLRARCEVVHQNPLVILDAAHNADSMGHLVQALKTLYPTIHFTVILASVQGKDIHGIVTELAKLKPDIILTNPHTPRTSALPQLQKECADAKLNVVQVIPELTSVEQLPQDKPLVFTGSFFTAVIGESFFN